MVVADVPEPAVLTRGRVVVHLEDEEGVLGYYLPRDFVYQHVTLLSEAEHWIEDPAVSAFIIDLILPSERGRGHESAGGIQKSTALIERIRNARPEVPVVVLTNHPGDDDLKKLIKQHCISAQDVFKKVQHDPQELVARLLQPALPTTPRSPAVEGPVQEETSHASSLDPRLRWLIARAKRGVQPPPTPSTQPGEIPILAEVTDLDAWNDLRKQGLRTGIAIPLVGGEGWIVTARMHWEMIEAVSRHSFVLGLEAAEPLLPAIKAMTQETSARRDLMPQLRADGAGRGAVVGLIDLGCAFAHDNFRHPDGTTRVIALWDQKGSAQGPGEVDYGRLYSPSEINVQLAEKNPYDRLQYRTRDLSHGTHVLDIAAGNGRGTRVEGVAWDADLIIVDLDPNDSPWTATDSFGDSIHLIEAVEFIFRTAGHRPCVVNLSLGTSGGPHDGTRRLDRAIDALVDAASHRAVVVAAGNFHHEKIHTTGRIRSGEATDVVWDLTWAENKVVPGHAGVEVWYPGDDTLEAELLDPAGESLARVELGQDDLELSFEGVGPDVFLALLAHGRDPRNGDHYVALIIEGEEAQGTWCLRLHGKQVRDGSFHAWLRASGARAGFASPCDDGCTLGSLATGRQVIAAGAYDANQGACPVCSFSSAGPTRDGRPKPDLSAPGEDIHAASGTCTTTCTVAMSGTSMSAPAVTGVVAVMLAEARACGILLTSMQIHDLLRSAVRRQGDGWHPRYGWGRLDARAAVLAVQALGAKGGGRPSDEVGRHADAPD